MEPAEARRPDQASGTARRPLREVQLGLMLAGEAGWLFAWSAALGGYGSGGPLLSLPAVIGILVSADVVTRLVLAGARGLWVARVVLALLGLGVTLLVGVRALEVGGSAAAWEDAWLILSWSGQGPRVAGAMALTLLAWWRGIRAGRSRPSLDVTESAFRVAVLALAGLFLLNGVAHLGDSSTSSMLVGVTALILFVGLTGLPLAAVLDVAVGPRHRGGPDPGVSGSWMGMLLAIVASLLLVSLLLAHSVTFTPLGSLLHLLLVPLNLLLWIVAYAIVLPLGLLFDALAPLLGWVLGAVWSRQSLEPTDLAWLDELRARTGEGGTLLDLLAPALRWVLAPALLALVVWLLAKAVVRLADWRSSDDVEEVRDFVWSWSELTAAVGRRVRALLNLPGYSTQRVAASAAAGNAGSPAWQARELYRALLRLGGRHGRRRAAAETPLEYERALFEVEPFAGLRGELRVLTEVYAQARYGAEPPATEGITAARSALKRLEGVAGAERGDSAAGESRSVP